MEDRTNAVFDVDEEVVDKGLDVVLAVLRWEGA